MVKVRIGDEVHQLTWELWERWVKMGRIPPTALVQFEAVTGSKWIVAQELEMYQSLRSDERLAWAKQFFGGPPPVLTALLVGVQIRFWWFCRFDNWREFVQLDLTKWTSPILENGEVWRILTMGFMHIDFFHIALNMLWLGYTGWNIERAYGKYNLAFLYLISVVGGSMMSMFGKPESPSLGASGGVFGLIAASVVFGFIRSDLLPEKGKRLFGMALLPYLVLMFMSGLASESTDNWSHFGGLLTGGLFAFFLDPEPLQRKVGHNTRIRRATTMVIASIFITMNLFGPQLMPLVNHQTAGRGSRDRVIEKALDYNVPASWQPRTNAAGYPTYRSPAGLRSFGVQERTHPTYIHTDELAQRFKDKLLKGFPEATFSKITTSSINQIPAHTLTATIPTAPPRTIVWTAAYRGIYSIEVLWTVEDEAHEHLAPLYNRLYQSVRWAEPIELTKARRDIKVLPNSRRSKEAMVSALARSGDQAGAITLQLELIKRDPSKARWQELIEILSYEEFDGAEELRSRAIIAQPNATIGLAVVKNLEQINKQAEAAGLLQQLWEFLPGDRSIRRARSRRGLNIDLDEVTGLPTSMVFDAQNQRKPDVLPGPPPDLTTATARGITLLAQEAAAP